MCDMGEKVISVRIEVRAVEDNSLLESIEVKATEATVNDIVDKIDSIDYGFEKDIIDVFSAETGELLYYDGLHWLIYTEDTIEE